MNTQIFCRQYLTNEEGSFQLCDMFLEFLTLKNEVIYYSFIPNTTMTMYYYWYVSYLSFQILL